MREVAIKSDQTFVGMFVSPAKSIDVSAADSHLACAMHDKQSRMIHCK